MKKPKKREKFPAPCQSWFYATRHQFIGHLSARQSRVRNADSAPSWWMPSSGSSSVGQQELGCSHSAEAKTHCPGNSPDKKRVLMTLASIPTRSDLSGPDILWTDWTYIFCTDYPDGLSGDHNQNLPNGLNASLPPKFLGPCHEATSARSAPSSLD